MKAATSPAKIKSAIKPPSGRVGPRLATIAARKMVSGPPISSIGASPPSATALSRWAIEPLPGPGVVRVPLLERRVREDGAGELRAPALHLARQGAEAAARDTALADDDDHRVDVSRQLGHLHGNERRRRIEQE